MEFEAVATLDAEHPVVGGDVTAGYAYHPITLAIHMQRHLASHTAVRAGGVDFVELPAAAFADGLFVDQGGGGAQLDALPALNTTGLAHGKVVITDNLGVMTAEPEVQHFVGYHLITANDTTAALDALGMIPVHELRAVIDLGRGVLGKGGAFDAQFIGGILQFAGTIPFASQTIVPSGRKQQVNDQAAGRADGVGFGFDDHAVSDLDGARRLETAHTFHFHEAETAFAGGAGLMVITQGGNMDAMLTCRLEQGLTGFHFNRLAIHRNFHHVRFP